jgi:hypothetical protein
MLYVAADFCLEMVPQGSVVNIQELSLPQAKALSQGARSAVADERKARVLRSVLGQSVQQNSEKPELKIGDEVVLVSAELKTSKILEHPEATRFRCFLAKVY